LASKSARGNYRARPGVRPQEESENDQSFGSYFHGAHWHGRAVHLRGSRKKVTVPSPDQNLRRRGCHQGGSELKKKRKGNARVPYAMALTKWVPVFPGRAHAGKNSVREGGYKGIFDFLSSTGEEKNLIDSRLGWRQVPRGPIDAVNQVGIVCQNRPINRMEKVDPVPAGAGPRTGGAEEKMPGRGHVPGGSLGSRDHK